MCKYQIVNNKDICPNIQMGIYDKIEFRESFWKSTTIRFFYIERLIEKYNLTHTFHIENDVMLYFDLSTIRESDKIVAVQDSPSRAICSIILFPNLERIQEFTNYIKTKTQDFTVFENDMQLMGQYTNKHGFNCTELNNLLFDGAAIGQYLGGIDLKNTNIEEFPLHLPNPTKGFENETCVFKCAKHTFSEGVICSDAHKKTLRYPKCENTKIANLHIHSKRLHEFSSVCVKQKDIVSGEKYMTQCDMIICLYTNWEYHSEFLKNVSKSVIRIKNVNDISEKSMQNVKNQIVNFYNKYAQPVKVFIYSNTFMEIYNHLLKNMNLPGGCISLYLHNSDENIDCRYSRVLQDSLFRSVYSQNLAISNTKCKILPIGLANESMFEHGQWGELYKVAVDTYKYVKKGVYINFNQATHPFRRELYTGLKDHGYSFNENKPWVEYLHELAKYKYAICPIGNGVDTHRFWECVYLGVIPIVIVNKHLGNVEFFNNIKKEYGDIFIIVSSIEDLGKLLKKIK